MDNNKNLMDLSELQEQVTELENNNVLVLAVAGAGKTRVLLWRYIWEIGNKNTPPNEIAIITFTRKAAKELLERIQRQKLPLPGYIGTIHGLAYKVLTKWVNPEMVVFEEKEDKPEVGKGIDWVEYGDDTIRTALQAIQDNPRCTDSLTTFLWDEAQDTSELDVKFVTEGYKPEKIFAVGDPNQEIYGFAGRKSHLINHLLNKKAALIRLVMDFRNTKEIADVASRIMNVAIRAVRPETGTIRKIPEYGSPDIIQSTRLTINENHPDWTIGILSPMRKNANKMARILGIPYKKTVPDKMEKTLFAWARVRLLKRKANQSDILPHVIKQYTSMIMHNGELYRQTAIDDVHKVMNILLENDDLKLEAIEIPEDCIKPKDYLDWYINRDWQKNDDPQEGEVRVMTMHASKGLEFDAVIVADARGPKWINDESERRRLWYVTVTRAKKMLVIFGIEIDPILNNAIEAENAETI